MPAPDSPRLQALKAGRNSRTKNPRPLWETIAEHERARGHASPATPDLFAPRSAEAWYETLRGLAGLEWVESDVVFLRLTAQELALMDALREDVRKHGPTEERSDGTRRANPTVKMLAPCVNRCRNLLRDLGLAPTQRNELIRREAKAKGSGRTPSYMARANDKKPDWMPTKKPDWMD